MQTDKGRSAGFYKSIQLDCLPRSGFKAMLWLIKLFVYKIPVRQLILSLHIVNIPYLVVKYRPSGFHPLHGSMYYTNKVCD